MSSDVVERDVTGKNFIRHGNVRTKTVPSFLV
jgi:hypothetical protein